MNNNISASWRLFLANWENFNKLFLYGYLWYGFCGGTAIISALRFLILVCADEEICYYVQTWQAAPAVPHDWPLQPLPVDYLHHRPGEAGGTVLLLPVQYCTHLTSRYLHIWVWIKVSNLHQIPIGNLHLLSTMAVLLSYFSRRPLLMRVVGVVVTTGTLARYLNIYNNIYDIYNIYDIISYITQPRPGQLGGGDPG